jgi:hypothetical protein
MNPVIKAKFQQSFPLIEFYLLYIVSKAYTYVLYYVRYYRYEYEYEYYSCEEYENSYRYKIDFILYTDLERCPF